MMRFKPEVRIQRCTPAIALMLDLAGWWSLRARVDVRINSVDDAAPDRVPDTFHGLSLAIDFGVDTNARADLISLAEFVRKGLPAGYDVILERDHLHVECDPHRPALPPEPPA